ncbi:MAG: 3'-5' exonuclease [Eubacteriales bacterium]|nr:3'-5' exonuclease [Eubacteriales bacterium]
MLKGLLIIFLIAIIGAILAQYWLFVILMGLVIYAIYRVVKKSKELDKVNCYNDAPTSVGELSNGKNNSDIFKLCLGNRLSTWENDYVVIDTETTGLSPGKDRVIEIAAVKVINGKIADSYTTLVNPRVKIRPEITSLTGITNGMLTAAPVIENVIGTINEFIGDNTLIGHNVVFDLKFLASEFSRCGLPVSPRDYIDTLPLARREFPNLQNHKLATLISELRLADKQDHRALSDANCTHRLYQIMRNRNAPEFVDLPNEIKPFLGITQAHVVKENEKKVLYNIAPQYRPTVINMVFALNPILERSAILVPTFDSNFIKADDVVFESFTESYVWNLDYGYEIEEVQPASQIEEHVFTPLGNIKKHPFVINFYTKKKRHYDSDNLCQVDEVCGKLFIDKDGLVSRIEISHWKNKAHHKIYCTQDRAGDLSIFKIESTDKNGMRFVKYKRD